MLCFVSTEPVLESALVTSRVIELDGFEFSFLDENSFSGKLIRSTFGDAAAFGDTAFARYRSFNAEIPVPRGRENDFPSRVWEVFLLELYPLRMAMLAAEWEPVQDPSSVMWLSTGDTNLG